VLQLLLLPFGMAAAAGAAAAMAMPTPAAATPVGSAVPSVPVHPSVANAPSPCPTDPSAAATPTTRQRRQFVDDTTDMPPVAGASSSVGQGSCVEVFGLESESGKALNGQRGIISAAITATKRWQVRLGPDKVVSVKSDNLKVVELTVSERLKVLGLGPAQASSETESCAEANAAPSPASLAAAAAPAAPCAAEVPAAPNSSPDAPPSAATSAESAKPAAAAEEEDLPFRQGNCVEVFGLESESGKLMNGQKGIITHYIKEKQRFQVSLDKPVALRAANLRLVTFELKPEVVVPPKLSLQAPPRWQRFGGLYTLVSELKANGHPVWKKDGEDRWLYTTTAGSWMFADGDEERKLGGSFKTNNGLIGSGAEPHGGTLPHLITGPWLSYQMHGNTWMNDDSVKVSAVEAKKDGPRSRSRSHSRKRGCSRS